MQNLRSKPLPLKVTDPGVSDRPPGNSATYEEAIARLMATMKEASAGKLVRTLAAVRDAKEAA